MALEEVKERVGKNIVAVTVSKNAKRDAQSFLIDKRSAGILLDTLKKYRDATHETILSTETRILCSFIGYFEKVLNEEET